MILSGQSADHKNNWYLPHLNSWSWVWTHDDLLYFWPNKHWSFFTMSLFSVSTVRALVWLWSCVISGRFLCRRWATFRPWRASGVNHLPRQLDGMRLRYWELLSLTCLPSFVFVQWGSGRHDGHPCGLILVLETAKWPNKPKNLQLRSLRHGLSQSFVNDAEPAGILTRISSSDRTDRFILTG